MIEIVISVGEKLYRERGAAAAQRILWHADPKTTSEIYSHIERAITQRM